MIEILNDFERHLIEDGKRPKTIESYVGDVKGLLEYINEMNVTFDGNLSMSRGRSY
jgi:integrase/recombinase XerD